MTRVLVTGSTAGLGRSAARQLLEDGHEVVLHARNPARADSVADLVDRAAGVYKRLNFDYEREVRIVVQQPASNFETLLRGGPLPEPLPGISQKVDLRDLLTDIVVSPYGSEWFLNSVRGLIRLAGLDGLSVQFSSMRQT
jgi:NAD(P)-dependent dehydrogenase (short-subunit alcohol dehydrogenase family)